MTSLQEATSDHAGIPWRASTRWSAVRLALALFVVAALTVHGAPRPFGADLDRLLDAKKEISLANLLSGLHLTPKQIDQLLALAREADAARDAITQRAVPKLGGAVTQYRQLLTQALASPEAGDPDVRERAQATDHEFREARDAVKATLQKLEAQASEVLTPNQRALVADFKPCLVPPQDFRDPVRVGQVANHDRIRMAVDALRRAPQDLYEAHVGSAADRLLAYYEKEKGRFAPGARDAVAKHLRAEMDRLRAMADADFALAASDAIEKILPFRKDGPADPHYWEPGKISQFLLFPGAATVLERWKDARAREAARPNAAPDTPPTQGEGARAAKGETERRFRNLMRVAKAMVHAAKQDGALPDWVPAERTRVEEMVRSQDLAGATAAVEKAVARLAGQVPPSSAAGLQWRAHRLRDLARQKRLEIALEPKADLFGLATLAKQALEAAREGKGDQALQIADQIEGMMMRFRE